VPDERQEGFDAAEPERVARRPMCRESLLMRFMLRESEAKNGGGGIRRRRAGARSAQADVPRIAPHAFYAARERSQKRRRRDSTPQSRSAQRAGRCAANRSSCVLCCARAKPKTEEEGFDAAEPERAARRQMCRESLLMRFMLRESEAKNGGGGIRT
jgi:hypothetical protein